MLIKLLQDVLYDEESAAWSDLLTFQIPVRDYFAKIGLELHLDEREGFAFLKQRDDEDVKLPRLVRRVPLSYEVSLLCVLLREMLEEFDVKDVASRKCFVTAKELQEKIEIFFRDAPNKVRLLDRFDKTIQTAARRGFLKETPGDSLNNETQNATLRRFHAVGRGGVRIFHRKDARSAKACFGRVAKQGGSFSDAASPHCQSKLWHS